jgi:hypothetical protein
MNKDPLEAYFVGQDDNVIKALVCFMTNLKFTSELKSSGVKENILRKFWLVFAGQMFGTGKTTYVQW